MDAMKLLIADGNEEFRRALAAELQGAYHVRCCGDGKEALSLLRSFVPDVLVLDLMLPELDGISLLQSAASAGLCPMVLYPAVGAVFGCKGTHVERSIRSAIDTAWKQRDDRVWQRYFRVGSDGVIPRPSNAAFISRLADALRLNQDAGNNEE